MHQCVSHCLPSVSLLSPFVSILSLWLPFVSYCPPCRLPSAPCCLPCVARCLPSPMGSLLCPVVSFLCSMSRNEMIKGGSYDKPTSVHTGVSTSTSLMHITCLKCAFGIECLGVAPATSLLLARLQTRLRLVRDRCVLCGHHSRGCVSHQSLWRVLPKTTSHHVAQTCVFQGVVFAQTSQNDQSCPCSALVSRLPRPM